MRNTIPLLLLDDGEIFLEILEFLSGASKLEAAVGGMFLEEKKKLEKKWLKRRKKDIGYKNCKGKSGQAAPITYQKPEELDWPHIYLRGCQRNIKIL